VPKDPTDPESKMLWEEFNYELACAELCGKSHYSMRRIVRIVSEDEYKVWLAKQQSYYLSSIRGKDSDPNKGKLLDFEIKANREALNTAVESAVKAGSGMNANYGAVASDINTIPLNFVQFESGSSALTEESKYQLNDLAEALKKYPLMKIEIAGHTDDIGDPAANKLLSQQRADSVKAYLLNQGITAARLTAVGYGSSKPIDTSNTDAGRQKNRRTEFRITAL
jgi:outer membrane protein OmpA-like peptidoglycan-associated protein